MFGYVEFLDAARQRLECGLGEVWSEAVAVGAVADPAWEHGQPSFDGGIEHVPPQAAGTPGTEAGRSDAPLRARGREFGPCLDEADDVGRFEMYRPGFGGGGLLRV